MPTFGKGRSERPVRRSARKKSRRAVLPTQPNSYMLTHTPLSTISRQFNLDLNTFTQARYRATRARVGVLDLFCAAGTAITELATQNESIVDAFGFSRDPYPEWVENKHVRFIQEEAESLNRYFKKRSLDLIFSWSGLINYDGLGLEDQNLIRSPTIFKKRTQKHVHFLNTIMSRLKPGGVLLTSLPLLFVDPLLNEVKKEHPGIEWGVLRTLRSGTIVALFVRQSSQV
ncbi:MAG: hypothetical protein AABX02_05220 [archaeon]